MLNPRRLVALIAGACKVAFWSRKKNPDAPSHPYSCAPPRRLALAALIAVFMIVCGLLLQWNILCTNVQTWRHVNRVCIEHMSGEAIGNLCSPLCISEDVESVACQSFHSGKAAVFTANFRGNRIVFKSPSTPISGAAEHVYWTDKKHLKHYPSQSEFINMIKDTAMTKLNIGLSDEKATNLSYLSLDIGQDRSETFRNIELGNVWFLLQSNEYLISVLFQENDIFPGVVGTCGSFYAVEYLESVVGSSYLTSLDDTPQEWERRVSLAIMIMDYIEDVEHSFTDPFYLCNVKLAHFGLTSDGQRLKYLDLDSVHPLSVANSLTGDGSSCTTDEECDVFDCRSRCNKLTLKCDHGVANNNLQIVCEKIFLGWVVSGRVLVPGLLLGVHAPHALTQLLSKCANPENEIGTPRSPTSKDIRRQLYNALIHTNEWV